MEDEIDWRLKQLAVEAQNHPARSRERNRALTKLIEEIGRCHKLVRPYAQLKPPIYENLYNEAYGRTLEYICLNIDNYRRENPVMAWVNQILKYRFQDFVDSHMREKKRIEPNRTGEIPSLDDLENYPSPDSPLSEEAAMLRELIEEDPDKIFRSLSVKTCPALTWQVIAKAKLDGETLKDISQEFGVPISSIDSFFKRKLSRNLSDYIRNRLQ